MNPWSRLGVRLVLGGGRRAWTRIALLASATAVGAFLLLGALAVPGVIDAQQDRIERRSAQSEFSGSTRSGLRIAEVQDGIDGRRLVRVAVAGSTPRPPGLDETPAEGEAVVSPALAELIRTDERVRVRFPQRIVGTIGPEGLVAPDELRAWVGVDPTTLAGDKVVTGYGPGIGTEPVELWVAIVTELVMFAPFLLIPLAVLLGACARLSAGAPDGRLATLRRLGATRHQAQLVTGAETAVVAATGALLGIAAFLLLRPLSGSWHLGRFHWYPDDVRTPPLMLAGVAAALVLYAVCVATYGAPAPDPYVPPDEAPAPRDHPAVLLMPVLGLAAVLAVLAPGLPLVLRGPLFLGGVALCAAGVPSSTRVLTAWLGRRLATAPGPVWLRIAGRRIDHTPSCAPRLIASVAVTLFLSAACLAGAAGYADWERTGAPTATFIVQGPTDGLRNAPGVVGIEEPVTAAEPARPVSPGDPSRFNEVANTTSVTISTDPAAIEAFSQYLAAHLPATRLEKAGEFFWKPQGHLNLPRGQDGSAVMTLTAVGLAITALLSGAAFGVAAIDRIAARRRANARLATIGVPRRVLAAAELASAAIPFLVAVAVAAGCAAVAVTAWAGALSLPASALLRPAAPLLWTAAGLLLVAAAIAPAAARQRPTAALLRRP